VIVEWPTVRLSPTKDSSKMDERDKNPKPLAIFEYTASAFERYSHQRAWKMLQRYSMACASVRTHRDTVSALNKGGKSPSGEILYVAFVLIFTAFES